MNSILQKYLFAFKKLRIDRAHGIAPHKPILLLSILQSYNIRLFNDNKIYITPELVTLFKSNWSLLVTTNHDCRFALPFYHLTSDKFWTLKPKSGFENILQISTSMRSFTNLNVAVDYAIIDVDLCELMKNEISNNVLRQFLLDEYFPSSKNNFNNTGIVIKEIFDDLGGKILNESPADYRAEIKQLLSEKNDEEVFLRGSIFKREVPKIYNNTCCISGMRIDAIISVSMIDACHIVPFSESYDDTITNGIPLCPNLHRAFDRGLISIDSDYKVIISKKFTEVESDYNISRFQNKKILLPKNNDYFPLRSNFKWHFENIFKG